MSAEASSADEMEAARDFGASSPSPQHWPSDPDPVTRATSHRASTTAEPSREHDGESAPVTAPFVPEPTPQRAIEAARDAEPRVPSPAPISRPVERAAPAPVALAETSNLVMVETRFAAPPAMEAEAPAVPRPRRERRPTATVQDEPLQLVETRKEQPSP